MSGSRRFGRPIFLWLMIIGMAAAFSCAAFSGAAIPDQLSRYVNDYAHVLSASDFQSLSTYLQQYEMSSGNQITVAIIPSLQGDVLEDFSIRLAEKWKMGKKGKDNGAILLVAMKEHKIRIEAGYGLEPKLTDVVSGEIIRNAIAPDFKRGQYAAGIAAGLEAMTSAIDGKPFGKGPAVHLPSGGLSVMSIDLLFFFWIFFVLALIIWMFRTFLGPGVYIGGGGFSGGGFSGGGGFGDFGGGGGGFGDFGSGGGGGGGFGGFGSGGGGGSFGGGGASGGW